jgi:hypothetical protein
MPQSDYLFLDIFAPKQLEFDVNSVAVANGNAILQPPVLHSPPAPKRVRPHLETARIVDHQWLW